MSAVTLTEEMFPSHETVLLELTRVRLDRLVGGPYPFLGRAIAAGSGLELSEYDVHATFERRYEITDRRGEMLWRWSVDCATLVQTPTNYIARRLDEELDRWYGPTIDAIEDYLWAA